MVIRLTRMVCVAALGCSLCSAASNEELASLIQRATDSMGAWAGEEETRERCEWLNQLAQWPAVEPAEEQAIATALLPLINSPNRAICTTATRALAQRGRVEIFPELLARPNTGVGILWAEFIHNFPGGLSMLPNDVFRQGLKSPNPETRKEVLRIIGGSNARELRAELEHLLINDSVEKVRTTAAKALLDLDCRESLPVLRSAYRGSDEARVQVAIALARFGGDAEFQLIKPLLQTRFKDRSELVSAIAQMEVSNPEEVRSALLPLLNDPSNHARAVLMKQFAAWADPCVLDAIKRPIRREKLAYGELEAILGALEAIGDAKAVSILHEMDLSDPQVREVALNIAHPSSAYAYWDLYLCNPFEMDTDKSTVAGDFDALEVAITLGDEEIFKAFLMDVWTDTADPLVQIRLQGYFDKLAERFPAIASVPVKTLTTTAPRMPSDRDQDGVPDRKDKYPDDDRRSEDIPKLDMSRPNFPADAEVGQRNYASIPLSEEGPA